MTPTQRAGTRPRLGSAHDATLFEGYSGRRSGVRRDVRRRRPARAVPNACASSLQRPDHPDLAARVEALQASYLDQGVTFDIGGEERAFPLDILPRVIEMDTWSTIERGVQQRVRALEAFLADVYDAGQVFADGVIPRRVIATSSHFHRAGGRASGRPTACASTSPAST